MKANNTNYIQSKFAPTHIEDKLAMTYKPSTSQKLHWLLIQRSYTFLQVKF